MSSEVANDSADPGRRHFLVVATSTIGLVGAVATAVPFLASWRPSAKAKALGQPVEVDIGKLEMGALMKIEWRGQAIYIVRRTQGMLEKLQNKTFNEANLRDANSENEEQQPDYIKGDARSIKPELLVLVGVCTHLGCAPLDRFQPADVELGASWPGGFYCPCHGSRFDLSGRVFKDVPAPDNLKVPPYKFMSDTLLMIGSNPGSRLMSTAPQPNMEPDFYDRVGGRLRALLGWVDARFPLTKLWKEQWAEYYAPKNFNFWYYFGSLAIFVLVIQIVSGIFLTMNYKPSSEGAFASVEYIMRDVEWGWLIRYIHSTGASAFFVVVYLHMFRGLLYGSYKNPRELLWIFGMVIYLALMAEAFFGYLLPWGNMSYWGAQVITSLFGAIPYIGNALLEWIRGDYYISDVTLNRFFALHVVALPLGLVFLVVAHLLALHEVGSNNPDGVEIKKLKDAKGHPVDGIPSHPYYTIKDIMGVVFFLILFAAVIFFAPTMGGYFLEHANFDRANNLVTPEHIAPVWYFTPYYAILRAVPNKLAGVGLMGVAVLILFFLPWLDRCKVKSIRYRSWTYKGFLAAFTVSFVALGYLGMMPVTPEYTLAARIFSVVYFLFFFSLPFYTKNEKTKPVPERVTYHAH